MKSKILLNVLSKLKQSKIFYTLFHSRDDAIMINVVVPGQRWEIEFLQDGTIEIEKFVSDGQMYGESELDILFKDFSD